jgi:hypothetical protein
MAIRQTQIGSTNGYEIYASTLNSAVTSIHICNTSANTIHFNLAVVQAGNEPSMTSNALYYNVALTSSDTYVIDTERLILSNGDSLRVSVPDHSVGIVVATVSYIGI